jgi:hypothetical protein
MGSTYTITTSDDEDNGIVFTAGDASVDKQVYLEACVHGQLLEPWSRNYLIAAAPVPLTDVATAYATGTPEQQDQVHQVLGLTPTPPAPGPTTYSYDWNGNGPPPNSGQARTDSRDWPSATNLWLSTLDKAGADQSVALMALLVGSLVRIEVATDAARYAQWTLNAPPILQTGGAGTNAVELAVVSTDAAGGTPGGTTCTVTITPPSPPTGLYVPPR